MNRINLKTLKTLWSERTPEDRMQWLAHAGFTGTDALRFHSRSWNSLPWNVKCKLLRGITYASVNLIEPKTVNEVKE